MNPLVQLLIERAPAIVAAAREALAPAAPGLTDAQVVEAFRQLVDDTLARDRFLISALRAEIAGGGQPKAD